MNITMIGSGSYKSSLSFRLVELGKQLASKGNRVTIVLPSVDKYNNYTYERHATIEGVSLKQPRQFHTKNDIVNLLPYIFFSFFTIIRSKPNILYVYKPTPATFAGLIANIFLRKRIVLDLDDLGSEVMRREGDSPFKVLLVRMCENLSLKYASSVVVASQYLDSLIKNKYPNKPRIIVPNGVDVQHYPKKEESALRSAVYYFGAINSIDLVQPLIESLAAVKQAVPDLHVTIIGGGSALPDAKKIATNHHVDSFITFTDSIKMFDLPGYTQFGDIAICYQPDTLTARAASNMKVFQYMALSSVSVVSNVGDLSSYVKAGEAGIVVEASNTKSLAENIISILNDPKKRIRIANKSRQLAETEYSWNSLGLRLSDFIENVAKEQASL